jgi:hypothetical protein
MYKVTATAALMLCGTMVWAAHGTPLTGAIGPISRDFSPIEKVGCERSGDNCPLGYRIERHGGGRWTCEPCWDQKHGSRYRDWNDRYSEPRRYREYGDYGSRRYRDYDDRYNEPRRYPREYY